MSHWSEAPRCNMSLKSLQEKCNANKSFVNHAEEEYKVVASPGL